MPDVEIGTHRINFARALVPRGWRVLSCDMLGQGRSSKPVLGVTIDDQIEAWSATHRKPFAVNNHARGEAGRTVARGVVAEVRRLG